MEWLAGLAALLAVVGPLLAVRNAQREDGKLHERVEGICERLATLEAAKFGERIAVIEANAHNTVGMVKELKADLKAGFDRLEREIGDMKRDMLARLDKREG